VNSIAQRKIRVMVVDDSAVMRQLLTAILSQDPMIEVVGVAADPFIARQKIKLYNPDVLTLDVDMPGMDGITFLEKLMRLRPMPVVMVSSLTEQGATITLRALELGAVDFVTKPTSDVQNGMAALADDLRDKVRTAARAHLRPPPIHVTPSPRLAPPGTADGLSDRVIAIGASAGGTQAIRDVLAPLPSEVPGIVIVQHLPVKFTRLFAERLNQECAIEVREAQDGDRVTSGVALVAPGGLHTGIAADRDGFYVRVFDDPPVNLHRPSVDVLFDSAARTAGGRAMGIILTGMGKDGAVGMRAMRNAGAHTIAQDEASCMVFGMPDQAIRHGGVVEIAPLDRIPERIVGWVTRPQRRAESG